MAATIGATADTRVIRGTFGDVFSEERQFSWEVAGDTPDGDIAALLDDYEAVTNVALTNVSVTDKKLVTGLLATATNALERVITAVMPLEFTAANPVNPSRPIGKVIKLRAPIPGVMDLDGSLVDGVTPDVDAVGTTTIDRLNRITGFFQDYAIARPSETDPIVEGGFTLTADGRFYTETGVMNGNPLD